MTAATVVPLRRRPGTETVAGMCDRKEREAMRVLEGNDSHPAVVLGSLAELLRMAAESARQRGAHPDYVEDLAYFAGIAAAGAKLNQE
ncbi:MAG: hypothetical protein U5S82_00340 [Gammaproteobacteria bacterium]|nr:hypothetical protein [Gammaproteobacteria bacterium]